MKEAKETRNAADLLTRQDILQYGLSFPGTYQEAPFHDPNWQLVRVKGSKKVFIWTYEKDGFLNLNVKVNPNGVTSGEMHMLQLSPAIIKIKSTGIRSLWMAVFRQKRSDG